MHTATHGAGATTSFYTRSTLVFPVPRADWQESVQRDTVPPLHTDALKTAATLQSAATLNSAVSVEDALALQSAASAGPRAPGHETPFTMSRKNTVRFYLQSGPFSCNCKGSERGTGAHPQEDNQRAMPTLESFYSCRVLMPAL